MKKEDKSTVIKELESTIGQYAHFYLADIGGLNAAQTSELRRTCYSQEIKLLVVKNTLLQKALENSPIDFSDKQSFTIPANIFHDFDATNI